MDEVKYFSGKTLASIILSVIALIAADIGFIFMEIEEIIFSVVLTLIILIPAFLLQFAARKEKIFIVWKILSYVSLGLCILGFLLITLLISSAIIK